MASLRQKNKNAKKSADLAAKRQEKAAKLLAQQQKEQASREAGRAYAQRKDTERQANLKTAARNTRKRNYNKDKAKEQRTHRQNTKFQALKMIGMSDAEAKKLSRGKGELSFPDIEKMAAKKSRQRKTNPSGKVYTAKQHLTVLWITFSGYGNFLSGHDAITLLSRTDKQTQAAQTYANSSEEDDNSAGARGNFLHKIGSKEVGETFIANHIKNVNRKNRRALNEDSRLNKQYEVILAPTNKFTVEGMLDLLNTTMSKVVPYRARDFYDMIQDYTREYLPKEFYDQIF